MKELVLMVEGQGDIAAAENLTSRMMGRLHTDTAWSFHIGTPMRVGDIYSLLAPGKQPYDVNLIRLLKTVESVS